MSDVLLKQAKTLYEWIEELGQVWGETTESGCMGYYESDIGNENVKLVRLDVAEQQIQKLTEQRNIESTYAEKMKAQNEVLEGRLKHAQQHFEKFPKAIPNSNIILTTETIYRKLTVEELLSIHTWLSDLLNILQGKKELLGVLSGGSANINEKEVRASEKKSRNSYVHDPSISRESAKEPKRCGNCLHYKKQFCQKFSKYADARIKNSSCWESKRECQPKTEDSK